MVDRTGSTLRRDPAKQEAGHARAVLDNPDLQAVFERARAQLIGDIEGFEFDGTPEREAQVVELVRRLQALATIRMTIDGAIRAVRTARETA